MLHDPPLELELQRSILRLFPVGILPEGSPSEFIRRVRRNFSAGFSDQFGRKTTLHFGGYELQTLRFLAEWADLQILVDASLGETLLKKMLDAASFLLQYWTTMPCSMEEMLRDSLEYSTPRPSFFSIERRRAPPVAVSGSKDHFVRVGEEPRPTPA